MNQAGRSGLIPRDGRAVPDSQPRRIQRIFQDDELNNISGPANIPAIEYAQAILTPRFFNNNFRPVGHFYYREMSLLYGLDFPKYLP